MAKAPNGILGEFSGKVGTVSGSKSKGKKTMRSLPKSRVHERPISKQNNKLGAMSKLVAKFQDKINIGFAKKGSKNDPHSLAMKYNLAHAITGKDAQINYPMVKFSDGTRERVWSEEIAFGKDRQITISWDVPEILNIKVIGKDIVHIVVYDATQDCQVYIKGESVRSDFGKTFTVDTSFVGSTLHAWIFFVSPDGKTVSDSDYLGSGIVFD